MPTATAFDAMEFRRALGTFATGVTVITARGPDGRLVGITANSFSSVSLDPPLVSWCLATASNSLAVFEDAGHFAIHILAADQEDVSRRFAKRGEDKFSGIDIEEGVEGTPLLAGCCARLQCRKAFQYEGGDHAIFLGEVLDLHVNDVAPLVFHKGSYALAARKADEAPLTQPAGIDYRDDLLGYLLWRAYSQFHSVVRARPEMAGRGDDEFLVMLALLGVRSRTLAELMEALILPGAVGDIEKALRSLEWLRLIEEQRSERGAAAYKLTESGRMQTLRMLEAARAVEAEALAKLGPGEGAALRNILKRFIVETNPGLPQFWDDRP